MSLFGKRHRSGKANRKVVPLSWFNRHEHAADSEGVARFYNEMRNSRAVDQGGQICVELDSTVMPSLRVQSGASGSVCSGVQPCELPAAVMSAWGDQALVAVE